MNRKQRRAQLKKMADSIQPPAEQRLTPEQIIQREVDKLEASDVNNADEMDDAAIAEETKRVALEMMNSMIDPNKIG